MMIKVSVDDATAFHALRGNTAWQANPLDRGPAMFKAQDYITAVYAIEGHEDEAAPKLAVMMLALEFLSKSFAITAPAQAIISEEFGAGNGAFDEKTTYAKPTTNDPFPLITAILAPIPMRVEEAARNLTSKGGTLTTFRLSR